MPSPLELLREVVLIEDGIWQAGPKAVANCIAEVMEGFGSCHPVTSNLELSPDQVIDRALKVQTSVSASEIAQVKKALSAVRDDLPTTFEAILGMVALEIERLQSINYISDEHRDICVQQIKTLSVLHRAIERLRNAVPLGAVEDKDAEKILPLGRVIAEQCKAWPRHNSE